MGTLTRTEMERIIVSGASVSINGRVIARVADLPTEADLARGDAVKEAAVATELQRQIAVLTAQVNSITAVQPPVEAPPAETPPADPPPADPPKAPNKKA